VTVRNFFLAVAVAMGAFVASSAAHAQRSFTNYVDVEMRAELQPGQTLSVFRHLNFGFGKRGECGRELNAVTVTVERTLPKRETTLSLYSNVDVSESKIPVKKAPQNYLLRVQKHKVFCEQLENLDLVNEGTSTIYIDRIRLELGKGFGAYPESAAPTRG
jgi:hypothetical protein